MSSTEFGDLEPADVWDADPTIAPEQVARRLHRLRRAVEILAGRDPGSWTELDRRARDDLLELGEIVTNLLELDPRPHVAEVARAVHNARRLRAGDELPEWEDLGADERRLGIELLELIIEWLEREGPR